MNENQEKQSLFSGRLARHIAKYNESHQNPVNRVFHYIGIPLETITILGFLSRLSWPGVELVPCLRPNLGMVLLIVASGWYLWCRPLPGLMLSCIGLTGYLIGSSLHIWTLVGVTITGAILNVIGHYGFERKPPQLLTRRISIIEAPVWLLAMMFGLNPADSRVSG